MVKARLLWAVGIAAVVGCCVAVTLSAQTPAPASPAFEVASVKLVEPPMPAHAVRLNVSPGRLTVDAATLRQIIGLAYGLQRVRVTDGPNWADADQGWSVARAARRCSKQRPKRRSMSF